MKTKIDVNGFDTLLQPTEWRYSAAAVGLVKYLDYHRLDYQYLEKCTDKPENYIKGFDGVMYNQSDITEERFLLFAEKFFYEDMTHVKILNFLQNNEFDEEMIKSVNDLIKSKSVLKNLFKPIKFDGTNKDEIISAIEENRLNIIKEIFRNAKNQYSNYCNTNLMLTDENPHCRLVGYTVDEGRKTRNLGFCFSKDSFVSNDISEFDFIPFAFSNSDMFETYFINNNFNMVNLVKSNERLSKEISDCGAVKDPKDKLLTVLKNAKNFIEYDVEIISKNRDNDHYETLFVRWEYLKFLQRLLDSNENVVKHLDFRYQISQNYWLNLEGDVYERCLNGVILDDLILLMLRLSFKDNVIKSTLSNRLEALIYINASMKKKGEIMSKIEQAKKLGFIVTQKFVSQKKENKVNSYRQKITGALVAHDYDRVKEVVLSLSSYVEIEFPFFYDFLENDEENKDIIFAFTSALMVKGNKEEE